MTHAVVEWLLSDATIRTLVGDNSSADTHKIYQAIVPQDEAPPYICIRVAGFDTSSFMCKREATNRERDRIQIDCYAKSYVDTYTLYRAVRQVLDGNSFTASDGTEIDAQIIEGRDYTVNELLEIAKRNVYGIVSVYDCDVTLGSIT